MLPPTIRAPKRWRRRPYRRERHHPIMAHTRLRSCLDNGSYYDGYTETVTLSEVPADRDLVGRLLIRGSARRH